MFETAVSKIAVAELMRQLGIERTSVAVINALVDANSRHLCLLAAHTQQRATHAARAQANLTDCLDALLVLGIDIAALEDYLRALITQRNRLRTRTANADSHVPFAFPRVSPDSEDRLTQVGMFSLKPTT